MRNFQLDQQFEAIKKAASDSVKAVFPVEGKLRAIDLKNVWIEDNLNGTDYADQAKTKAKDGTWGIPVYAHLILRDKQTGQTLDENKKIRLFNLPKLTNRFSYIVNGNEYQVTNQLRLKPGVYTLRKQNGELKTQVNLSKGKNFDIAFDEASGVFFLQKVGGRQNNIPLYPLLTYLGVSPSLVASAWGSDLEKANHNTDPKIISRVAEAFQTTPDKLKGYLAGTQLDPETTKMLLGQEFGTVDGPMLLASSKKLLSVHLGKQEPDDRDSLAFKSIHSLDDMLKERLEKNKMSLAYKVARNVDNLRRTKLSQIVNPGAFNSVVQSFFTQDERSATPEQTNPLEMVSGQYKATIMGPGGITSNHQLTQTMREVHSSHYGFIDPIAVPECYDEQTEVFTRTGWKCWKDVNSKTEFACRIDGEMQFHKPTDLHQSLYSGVMYGVQTLHIDFLVTPNHRMYTRPMNSKSDAWRFETAEKMLNKPRTFCVSHTPFSPTTPAKEHIVPHVYAYGSNAAKHVGSIDINDWCEFMGWFLSEGSVSYDESKSLYMISISQAEDVNPDNCADIKKLLNKLPWKWCQRGDRRGFHIGVKDLAHHLKDQGYCDNKYIPEELFEAPVQARKLLLETLLLGDGRISRTVENKPIHQKTFTTTSRRLAEGFYRLSTGLGHTTKIMSYEDKREERYLDVYEVRIIQTLNRSARGRNVTTHLSDYYTANYCGNVYCATVPGGLLLVKRGRGIPLWLGNSHKIGASGHLPLGTAKDGTELTAKFLDSAGKDRYLKASETYDKYIGFPGQDGSPVKALYQGKTVEVPRSKIDFWTPRSQALFTWSTNLVPFMPADNANRVMMATHHLEQAISLKHREKPLVQVATDAGKSLEEILGHSIAVHAADEGVVKKITPDAITVKTKAGDVTTGLYNNFTLNRKSFMHHTPLVKVGDKVRKGQLLAESNYSKDGTLALGTNMRVAYVPYKSLNFEDGIVVTETAAKKLTSEHIHQKSIEIGETTILNTTLYRSLYPNVLTAANLSKLDNNGVIKKGERVKMGEALIAGLQKRMPSQMIGALHKSLSDRPKDVTVYWTNEDEGVILDVQKNAGKVTVFVKTEESAKVGDKLSGRHGNKGTITKILPDHEAPHTADGKPVEMMLSPAGIISRVNIGQIYESAAGKAALKAGETLKVSNFGEKDYLKYTQDYVDKHGVNDKEELIDPATGKSMGKVHVGNPYILKLYKQGAVNYSVRQGGPGQPYDANAQPAKPGGEDSAKSMDVLTIYSLLSHGARANLREMMTHKSDQNDEVWKALKSGQQLPPPKVPFVYDKFLSYLKGAGIDTVKKGTELTLAPLTDAQVMKQSSGAIKETKFYRAKDMQPYRGGFLDPVTLGGFKGTKWGHLELHEAVVNPVFENAIKKITGLGKKFDQVMSGELFLHNGELNSDGKGVTGGAAIEKLLKAIDVDKEIGDLTKKAEKAKEGDLDAINKKLRYLTALKTTKLSPVDAYMRKVIPVLPPVYRPIHPLPDGNVTTSDLNLIYQNVGALNDLMKLPVMKVLHEKEKAVIRSDLYNHVKGLSGLTDLNIKGKPREGFISEIKGGEGQPKEGFFISKMFSKKQDFVGRGTIIPNPDIGIDQIGVPEEMCWKLFEPFIMRELATHGKTPLAAKDEIKQKTLLARTALAAVLKERHVLINRAPSLHKFSISSAKPVMVSGRALQLPPLITKGLGADFDGDTMVMHMPITDAANAECANFLPSKNLFSPGSGNLMVIPAQEAQIGLFYLSQTSAGRAQISKLLGPKYTVDKVLDKKATAALLSRIAKEVPNNEYGNIVQALKKEGDKHAFETGVSLGLEDLTDMRKDRDKVMNAVVKEVGHANTDAKMSALNVKSQQLMDAVIAKHMQNKGNALFDFVHSGSRGDASQLRSIVASPMFVSDVRGNIVKSPIKKSYAEGLDMEGYWTSLYGARRGMIDRTVSTSEPGAFSKEVLSKTVDNVISAEDCGTRDGVNLPLESHDTLGRCLAGDQGGAAHNTVVDHGVVSRLKKAGLETVKVRSPLTCRRPKGTCARCYGIDEHGGLPHVGDNVGAKAGQTISEPLTQMVLSAFHTGGVAGTGHEGGVKRVKQLLQLPGTVAGSAALAPQSGAITKINPGLAGGFDVYMGTVKTHVPHGTDLKVKAGQQVEAGDVLSSGPIKPQDLVKHKGMLNAQLYMVNELQKTYADQKIPIHRKIFETVVRSLGNTTRVLNNPQDSEHLPGDIIPYTVALDHNLNLKSKVPTAEATGMHLAHKTGPLAAGTAITEKEIRLLKALGHNEVDVTREAIVHAPFLKGVNVPLLSRNWMSSLGFRDLKEALVEGANQGWKTDTSGENPIPALVHGTTFGQGKDGRY